VLVSIYFKYFAASLINAFSLEAKLKTAEMADLKPMECKPLLSIKNEIRQGIPAEKQR